jgi:hypothetical protein
MRYAVDKTREKESDISRIYSERNRCCYKSHFVCRSTVLLVPPLILLFMATVTYCYGQAVANPPIPQNMWTETYRSGPYSTEAEIQEELESPSRFPSSSPKISILSASIDQYIDLFEEHKENVASLRVVGASNEDVVRLSEFDSLVCLALPMCEADDFRPLTKLNKLRRLSLANPNLEQFRDERLLDEMESLRSLTLYNVSNLQETLDLPGLVSSRSFDERGLFSLVIQTSQWHPVSRIAWPQNLESLQEFSVVSERARFAYVQQQRAEIIICGDEDNPDLQCRNILRDIIGSSGFYDDREVISLDMISRSGISGADGTFSYESTNISPLQVFSHLEYLTLEGDFCGYESLSHVPLVSIRYVEGSPRPSDESIENLERHPTLDRITSSCFLNRNTE